MYIFVFVFVYDNWGIVMSVGKYLYVLRILDIIWIVLLKFVNLFKNKYI